MLSCKLWWQGPHWLASKVDSHETIQVDSSCFPMEERGVVCTITHHKPSIEFNISRYSTLERAMKVMGWILRFISVMKGRSSCSSSQLSLEELSAAKWKLILLIQEEVYFKEIQRVKGGLPVGRESSLRKFNPFIGPDSILRVRGRLARSCSF